MTGWLVLGLVGWFVAAFPLGCAVGRYLRTRQPAPFEEARTYDRDR